jgi:hypothetical protein
MDTTAIPGRRKLAWISLFLIVAIAFATVFIPAWLITPFKAQTSRGVTLSYVLKSWSPLVTFIAVIVAVGLAAWLWRGARWIARIAVALLLIPAFVAVWFAQQNHFEWMFNPLPDPAYAKISEANFISDRDMVMAIVIDGDSVAYPVRQMAYHHVVQDTVGGIQVVTTY